MTQDELSRVRDDLETMKSAIGLPPRWDPREVRINLLLAAAGLAATVWALIPHGLSPLLGLCFFAVPVVEWIRFGRTPESYTAGREFRSALRTVWLALPLIALFAWCRQVGVTPLQFLGLSDLSYRDGLVLRGPRREAATLVSGVGRCIDRRWIVASSGTCARHPGIRRNSGIGWHYLRCACVRGARGIDESCSPLTSMVSTPSSTVRSDSGCSRACKWMGRSTSRTLSSACAWPTVRLVPIS